MWDIRSKVDLKYLSLFIRYLGPLKAYFDGGKDNNIKINVWNNIDNLIYNNIRTYYLRNAEQLGLNINIWARFESLSISWSMFT